jgi:hypothetical protein
MTCKLLIHHHAVHIPTQEMQEAWAGLQKRPANSKQTSILHTESIDMIVLLRCK